MVRDVRLVGGKNASLGEMVRELQPLGIQVPAGFAVTAEAYRYFLKTAQLDATLRVDRYDEFGASWSPSIGAGWWPVPRLRLRASAGRAFRVPTFTER